MLATLRNSTTQLHPPRLLQLTQGGLHRPDPGPGAQQAVDPAAAVACSRRRRCPVPQRSGLLRLHQAGLVANSGSCARAPRKQQGCAHPRGFAEDRHPGHGGVQLPVGRFGIGSGLCFVGGCWFFGRAFEAAVVGRRQSELDAIGDLGFDFVMWSRVWSRDFNPWHGYQREREHWEHSCNATHSSKESK